MSIQQQFEDFTENIKLTPTQREDAKTKYSGVCKKLHEYFYPTTEYDGSTKLLFGSYAKHTAIRPMSKNQDVDVLFKIPKETFQQYTNYTTGGQSALLQKIRDILLESKYSLSDKPKAWGKVILITTADGTHNVELLPAYEQEDGMFIIPNSENGGSWDVFDPRSELTRFSESNDQTDGLTKELSRMVKRWGREVSSLTIKSFEIENFVMLFLTSHDYNNKNYSQVVTDFFTFLDNVIDIGNHSHVETAKDRADKALAFEHEGKIESATTEWKKIFGDNSFPALSANKGIIVSLNELITDLQSSFPSASEEFLDSKYGILTVLNLAYSVNVEVQINQNGWRQNQWLLSEFKRCGYRIQTSASLLFRIASNNVPKPYRVKWKVRNFGEEAKRKGALRGEISDDDGSETKKESTLYHGEHYVECYIIKDGQCIANGRVFVPIG